MGTDHLRNMESATRPALALGLMAALPIMELLAPFVVVGFILVMAFVFAAWTFDAAMLPLAANDEALSALMTTRFGAKSAIWGAVVPLVLGYVVIGTWGWVYRLWPALNWRLAACLLMAYGAYVGVAGAVHGTHFPAQVAYAWEHPGRSAAHAWNCPASLASGKAETRGTYDLSECRSYVDEAATRAACRQVMRLMAPLSGPQYVCAGPIREITGHEWPMENWVYTEWDTSFRKPIRNPPLATPAKMRVILAKEGMTPRT